MKKITKKHIAYIPVYFTTALIIIGMTINNKLPVLHPSMSLAKVENKNTGNSLEHKISVEAVFVLDTTSSMSGLIKGAKQKIWSIASTLGSAQQNPDIKIGIIAFRDKGDQYITKKFQLTENLDEMYSNLMELGVAGGGDGPEDVNKGLDDAVNNIKWSKNKNVYKVIFLVGDAQPHMDYQNEKQYPQIIKEASEKGIVVNAIQCGNNTSATGHWKKVANLSQGKFFKVDQGGGVKSISTPFDKKIARLTEDLEGTRMVYGKRMMKDRMKRKYKLAKKIREKAGSIALATRGVFSSSKSGMKNFLGKQELVADISSGKRKVGSINESELPRELQGKTLKEKKAIIAKNLNSRNEISKKIKKLSKRRQVYLSKKIKAQPKGKGNFEMNIYKALKSQAKKKGLVYKDGPKY